MTGWPALLVALGGIAILFALVSFVLGLLGAWTDLTWIIANAGLGAVLVATALAMSAGTLRERLASGESRRVGKYGSSALLQAMLLVVILGCVAFVAARHPTRWDWSEAKVHSLSDQTRKVLEGLDRDVQVVGFYSPADISTVRDLLERYAYAADRFHFELYDPRSRPDLVERYEIDRGQLGRGLLKVTLGEDSVIVEETSEEKVTNALVQLGRTSQKRVYFLEGHNERPVEGEGAEVNDGYARAAEALRNENYRFERLLLATQGDVPDDADVVVLAGPTRPLSAPELAALRRYVGGGGALMVLLDPRANTNVPDLLKEWGIEAGNDVVVDRVQGLFGQAMSPFARRYGQHPITEGLREVTLFHVARSVKPGGEAKGDFTELVYTSENAWGERNLDLLFKKGVAELGEDDLRGPVPVAVAGTPDDGKARLVVFGDSDFAANALLDSYRNRDLFVNTVNWLLGDVEAISIRPKHTRASRLQLSADQFSQIRYLCLFVLPEAIALVGAVAWWSRRRAPGR